MNSCDNCRNDCIHLDDCLSELYRDVLKRCNVNIQEEPPESPEVSYKAKEGHLGEGIKFERIRRCTGYLSGDYQTRFNDAKKAEVEDRMTAKARVESYHEV